MLGQPKEIPPPWEVKDFERCWDTMSALINICWHSWHEHHRRVVVGVLVYICEVWLCVVPTVEANWGVAASRRLPAFPICLAWPKEKPPAVGHNPTCHTGTGPKHMCNRNKKKRTSNRNEKKRTCSETKTRVRGGLLHSTMLNPLMQVTILHRRWYMHERRSSWRQTVWGAVRCCCGWKLWRGLLHKMSPCNASHCCRLQFLMPPALNICVKELENVTNMRYDHLLWATICMPRWW